MDYHNIFAREQLLKVARDIEVKRMNIKHNKFDEKHNDGARQAFADALELIYERIEKLQEDKK